MSRPQDAIVKLSRGESVEVAQKDGESASEAALPEGWASIKVGDIVQLNYGKALSAKKRDNEGYPVYGSNGVIGKHSEPLLQGPTLLVGRKGSIGEVHFCEGRARRSTRRIT